jgi:release factor glutamine methyltransferase
MRPIACLPPGWMMKSKTIRLQTIGDTIEKIAFRLKKISETPELDSQVLLARLLDQPRSWVLAHPESTMSKDQLVSLEKQIVRLEDKEPLPYVLGAWEFFGLEFDIDSDVLIPRPETEQLVERALEWLMRRDVRGREIKVLEVGTGSGCIAISLAKKFPELSIIATDLSSAALAVARINAEKFNVSNSIQFIEADLFSKPLIPYDFLMILANLPYIPTKILHKTRVYGCEPSLALDGGADGLELIRPFIKEVPNWLVTGGLLLMEIEASEGAAVFSLASSAFPEARLYIYKDIAGHDRLLEVQA